MFQNVVKDGYFIMILTVMLWVKNARELNIE